MNMMNHALSLFLIKKIFEGELPVSPVGIRMKLALNSQKYLNDSYHNNTEIL